MQEVGFIVERLPGPPGKREMLRATKIDQPEITHG
jgi:tRNA U34 5-methylaminomethyl-2-thiouridine-forming methyltransferase MnmC